MSELPTGTVTFLLTDIEGSTRLWEQHPDPMRRALARHHDLIAALIEQQGGVVVKRQGEGDSVFAVFAAATDAVTAAAALQEALLAEPWPAETPLRVRMALHTGEAELRDGDYFGPAVNRCARLRAVAHGGQVLLSQATADLLLPSADVSLRDLGSHRLKDLQQPEHLFQLLHPALPADFPPLRSLEAFAHNLPRQLTSFIGREGEMAAVKRLLAGSRLLTLTGAGGCGKTRLALQVAADLVEEYADGVWLVELAPLADPALVPPTVASALGVREEPGRTLTQTLAESLRAKSLLLVLDNCEHLLSGCASLADTLLRRCPELQILATSREALHLAGERTYRVPSLSLPDPRHLPPVERLTEYEAVRLFVERAVFAQPSFALTDQNALAVAQVCQRLDGIPLALELAAARVTALSVEELNARLDDMFRVLSGGTRAAPPRQQTLRALIDWSYDLLSPPERALLRRLAVFAGGCTLDAAEAVCVGQEVENREVLDLLTRLVQKSLVLYEERSGGGWYRLLETVRQYARDQLREAGEEMAVRDSHRDWFLALAETVETKWVGADQGVCLDRLERERDNFRVALVRSQIEPKDSEVGLRLAGSLLAFWRFRGYWSEGRKWLEDALSGDAHSNNTAARAKALRAAGALAWQQRDFPTAHSLLQDSLAIWAALGLEAEMTCTIGYLTWVALQQGNLEEAHALATQCLSLSQKARDNREIAAATCNLAHVALAQDDCELAASQFQESLSLYRALGLRFGMAASLSGLGDVALQQGDLETARAFYTESLAHRRALGEKKGMAFTLAALGSLALGQGDMEAATQFYTESLALMWELGDKRGIVEGLEGLAGTASAAGHVKRAAWLFGAAEELRGVVDARQPPSDRAEHSRFVAAARSALGEEALAAAWAEGQALPLQQAVEYALQPEGASADG